MARHGDIKEIMTDVPQAIILPMELNLSTPLTFWGIF